ncbi:MAG: hypothetical protein QME52_01980 [Bacteroidota bacterium]|nr:hypothetical protein [Bacteroidota bacterium]
MNAIYDVVCSVVVGGIILMMLFGFNGNVAESAASQTVKLVTQTNLTAFTDIMEYEFRKMGYRVGSNIIIFADSLNIRFRSDVDNNGVIDTIQYYLDKNNPSGFENKNTRILYRKLNSGPLQRINLGITQFRITYQNIQGQPFTTYPVPTPSLIRSLTVVLSVESTFPFKESSMKYLKYNPGVYWERTMKPKNLR